MDQDNNAITIALMQKQIEDTNETVNRLETKLDKFIESSERHFAAKWTETALKWFIFTIAGLIITYAFIKFVGGTVNTNDLKL